MRANRSNVRKASTTAILAYLATISISSTTSFFCHAFNPSYFISQSTRKSGRSMISTKLLGHANLDDPGRRLALHRLVTAGGSVVFGGLFVSQAQAKVEGYAPPKKSLSEEYRQGTAALSDSDENAIVPKEAYVKLPSGVTYADLREGTGEVASEGKRVNIQWVLRKSNGYFVDSSEASDGVPFIFTVGDKGAIQGLDEGIRGMKAGGVRRILMPPSLAYVEGLDDGKPGPIPAGFGPRQQMRRVMSVRKDVPGEYVFLEVQLTRVR